MFSRRILQKTTSIVRRNCHHRDTTEFPKPKRVTNIQYTNRLILSNILQELKEQRKVIENIDEQLFYWQCFYFLFYFVMEEDQL